MELEGRPSINILTLSFPLKLTFPSPSTETEGTLSNTSLAVPPLTVMSCPTLYIFLSSFISTVDFSLVITTSLSWVASGCKEIVPRLVSVVKVFPLISEDLKDINSIFML